MLGTSLLMAACALVGADQPATVSDANAQGAIQIFNGKDLSGFYTFIKDRGRDVDPNKVFTVQDGVIRVSGEELGCITTNDEFENYRLVVEFKWGDKTWAPRVDRCRDSGVLIHSVGKDGAYGGVWMNSIECQVIEGGTGDFIVVGDGTDAFSLTTTVAPEKCADCYVYQQDGQPATINGGRINWFGRDPAWTDTKDFRGKQDAEKPAGEWNTYEIITDGSTITNILNGVTVNKAIKTQPSKGRIQLQSEYAEIFFRRVEVIPLKK